MRTDKCIDISNRLEKSGKIKLKNKEITVKNGLVYVDGDTGRFENPMTWDTFTYHYLYETEL